MVNTYPDIAIRPGISTYPLVNQRTSGIGQGAAADAAAFQRILNMPAPNAASGAPAENSAAATPAPTITRTASTGSVHLTFTGFLKDIFDIINPLQHIPIVSAIYRHLTGDQISPEAEFIGDSLYGGPIGGAVAAANIAYKEETGQSIGQTVIADLTGQRAAQSGAQVMVAQNMQNISPAAIGGQSAASDIIWWNTPAAAVAQNKTPAQSGVQVASNTVSSQPPDSLSPPSAIPGTNEEGPASPSTAPPTLQPKGAASTIVLHTQEAPAGTARKAMPPELIAQKMMMRLEKYAAMKRNSLAPTLSANF